MPMEAADLDALKANFKVSRKRAVNFGFSLSSKAEESVVYLDRRKKPESLMRNAKKLAKSPKVAAGAVETKGKDMTFSCLKAPPGGAAKLLKMFFKKTANLSVKVILKAPDGKEQKA